MNKVYRRCQSCNESDVLCNFNDGNPTCLDCFHKESMTISQAIECGIRRVYSPIWCEKNAYVLLPKKNEKGTHGPWGKLYSEETQILLGFECPQEFLLFSLVNGLNSLCHEYLGDLSKFDTEDQGGEAE
jgi:hypothetical protein